MPDDWKTRIDELERQAIEKARIEQQKKEETMRKKQMEGLKKFKCHICGKASNRPAWANEYDHASGYDWSQPGDLDKCRICHKWTCSEHLYKGICEVDGRKL